MNVVEQAVSLIYKQQEKGLKKYGQPINPKDSYNWLEMKAEELVDGLIYTLAQAEKLKIILQEIEKLKEEAIANSSYDAFNAYCNVLELFKDYMKE